MKQCPHCKVGVYGSGEICPLCQNNLLGEGTSDIWPTAQKLKKQSMLYKIQLFLVLAAVAITITIDFLFDLHEVGFHWSLLVALWGIGSEVLLIEQIKRYTSPAKFLTVCVVHVSVLLLITGWYLHTWKYYLYWIIPVMCCVTLLLNLLFAIIDKKGNAFVYLLANIFVGVVPYAMLYAWKHRAPMAWTINLLLSVITFIAVAVFRGRSLWMEVRKRMTM